MPETAPPETDDRPGLGALFGQLADDTREFARAEVALLKAQAGERASYAVPGLVAILLAAILAFAAIVALLVGAVIALTPAIGAGWATAAVTFGALLIAGGLGWLGVRRLRKAAKPRELR
jgi:hypothetical protein